MVTLPQYVRDSLKDKSLPEPSKKGLSSPFGLSNKKKIYLAVIWKKGFVLKASMIFTIPTGRVGIGVL